MHAKHPEPVLRSRGPHFGTSLSDSGPVIIARSFDLKVMPFG